MPNSDYVTARTSFLINISSIITDDETIRKVKEIFDVTMKDYEVNRKEMALITSTGFPDVAKYYLASRGVSNLSKKTLTQYKYKLTHFFETVKKSYSEITTGDINHYLFYFKQDHNVSDRYMDNIRITLNTFFQWLVDNEYLERNPCARVDKIKYHEKLRTPLSTLSLEDLRWHCEDVREKALIDFLFSTGCRVGECVNVTLDDINWENNSVHLRYCKGNKERTVFFNDESKISLRAYIEQKGYDSPYLWTSTRQPHNQLKEHALENIVKKVGERIGAKVYPHKLRHTFATVGIRNGMTIDELQRLLGHTNPQTTMIYAHLNDEIMKMEHMKAFC